MHKFKTTGTCAIEISYEVKDNRVYNVGFVRGCNGNLKGISSLVEGMDIDEIINRLDGIKCGQKSTSCPEQLAKALISYKESL